MSPNELITLIPPPSAPKGVGTLAEWQAVEKTLGVILPFDFRNFIFTYGTGYLGRFYSVWNPFDGAEYVSHVRLISDYERDLRRQFPRYYPCAIYPESPGFLPWGNDDNGNYYGWLTDGDPDDWMVLSNEVRGEHYRLHQCSATTYLTRVFRGEVRPLASGYPTTADLVFEA